MPTRTGRKQKRRPKPARNPIPRTGLPAPDSVVDVVPFTSPAKKSYRILKTVERDAYDADPSPTRPRHR